jgi:hypothetical protein
MLDEADELPIGNNSSEIETAWHDVLGAFRAGHRLAEHRDEGVWRELESIARLFDVVTAGRNDDPEIAWWGFLAGKGVRRGKRRGRRLLFYGLLQHLTNEHAGREDYSKSIISRRATVLQHWHDMVRATVTADQVANWIASNHGVKALAEIANPPKPHLTKDERKAARVDRKEWFRRLTECDPLISMDWDADSLPDNRRPYADGGYRLALVQVRKTDTNAAMAIISMVDDVAVSQTWLEQNAQGLVENLPATCRNYEAAGARDAASLPSKFSEHSATQFSVAPEIQSRFEGQDDYW